MFKKQFIDFVFKDTGKVINFNLRIVETSFQFLMRMRHFFTLVFSI